MDPVVESPASAQPAPEPTRIDAQTALDAMTPAQTEKWRATGELPSTLEVVSDGTPAPAKPAAEDAPAIDAKGQPVTGKDGKPLSVRQQKQNEIIRRGVEEGIATERARVESLERELRELKARSTPAQPVAVETPAPKAADADPDAEPVLDDFLDQPDPFVAHAKALGRWAARQEFKARDEATNQRTAAEREHQAVVDRFEAHQAREAAFKATVPDYDAKTLPIRQQMVLTSPLTLAVLESPASERLVLHFAEHPADFERIGRLGAGNLPAALREIGRLEAKYDTTSAPAAPEAAAPKHVSDAPDPAPVLGSRPAEPGDPVESAIRRKDPGEYMRAANARELAAARK